MDYRTVLCMGGCVIDRIGETADAIERLNTSNIGTMRTSLGGVARNVAENLARLGIGVELFSRVGEDAEGRYVLDESRRSGIDMHLTSLDANNSTATYTAIFNGEGELVIGLADMAIFDSMSPHQAEQALCTAAQDAILFVDANPPITVLEAIAANKRGRILAAVPVSQQKMAKLMPILAELDVLFINRYEAQSLLGSTDTGVMDLARGLAAGPVQRGLLTLGAEGALAWENGQVTAIPALPSQPVNVNGAGDALAGATLARLAAGDEFYLAARRAMAAAALTVEAQHTVRTDLTMDMMLRRCDLSC